MGAGAPFGRCDHTVGNGRGDGRVEHVACCIISPCSLCVRGIASVRRCVGLHRRCRSCGKGRRAFLRGEDHSCRRSSSQVTQADGQQRRARLNSSNVNVGEEFVDQDVRPSNKRQRERERDSQSTRASLSISEGARGGIAQYIFESKQIQGY